MPSPTLKSIDSEAEATPATLMPERVYTSTGMPAAPATRIVPGVTLMRLAESKMPRTPEPAVALYSLERGDSPISQTTRADVGIVKLSEWCGEDDIRRRRGAVTDKIIIGR